MAGRQIFDGQLEFLQQSIKQLKKEVLAEGKVSQPILDALMKFQSDMRDDEIASLIFE